MNRRIYGFLGIVATFALAGSCKDDPTEPLRGGPSLLQLEFNYREVIISDSVRVSATVRDGQNNALPEPVTITSCNTGIVSITPTSAAPLPETAFFVKGVAYGTTCVAAAASGLTDTMSVATFPRRIAITSPDILLSGAVTQFVYTYFDARGNALTGLPAPTWSTTDANVAAVTAAGIVTPKDPGQARITVVGVGSVGDTTNFGKTTVVAPNPFSGTIVPSPAFPGQTVTITRGGTTPVFDANSQVLFNNAAQTLALNTADSVRVALPDLTAAGSVVMIARRLGAAEIAEADTFNVLLPTLDGTVTPAAGVPTDTIQVTRGTGPVFDVDTRAYIGGLRTFIIPTSADQIGVVVPGVGVADTVTARITRAGPTNEARRFTFTSTTASRADHYDLIGNDGFPVAPTNPSITANGDYYIIESGTCDGGAPTDPGDDCDDFFRVANPSATDTLFASVQLDWFSGSDVDILWCKNTTCSGAGNVVTGGGATLNNPEVSNVKIPPGATWFLWINYFEPIGVTKDVLRVRFSGFP